MTRFTDQLFPITYQWYKCKQNTFQLRSAGGQRNIFLWEKQKYRERKQSVLKVLSGLLSLLLNWEIIDLHHCISLRCSVQFSCSVVSNSLRPMNRSTPGLPVHHQLPKSTQTHVHWVGDVIQPSHPLSSPSPPAFNLSQYQGLFKWVSSLHQVAKILEFQLQHQSFQWIPRTDFL